MVRMGYDTCSVSVYSRITFRELIILPYILQTATTKLKILHHLFDCTIIIKLNREISMIMLLSLLTPLLSLLHQFSPFYNRTNNMSTQNTKSLGNTHGKTQRTKKLHKYLLQTIYCCVNTWSLKSDNLVLSAKITHFCVKYYNFNVKMCKFGNVAERTLQLSSLNQKKVENNRMCFILVHWGQLRFEEAHWHSTSIKEPQWWSKLFT
jgi:hypothetical protein